MKCPGCGAEIALLDKFCPYCGAVNKESASHQEEMDGYRHRSSKTKSTANANIGHNLPILIASIVMILLLVGISIASYVAENAFIFPHHAARSESLKKSNEHSEVLRQYLADGDYIGFAVYKELHVIPEYEEQYSEFNKIWDLIYEYRKVMSAIEESVMYGPEARRSQIEDDVSDCRYGIVSFYREYEQSLKDMEGDRYIDNVHDMKKRVDAALKIYLGLEGGKLDEFMASSSIQQEAYLEEVLGDE
ncbi:MAG: hypothetical protein K5686_07180 [Lachnospiraceae bacterium]|nr:hypothetical protein [Lachnospiraceae bacterium]